MIFSSRISLVINGPLVKHDGLPVGGYILEERQIKFWIEPLVGGGNFELDNGIFGRGIDGEIYMVHYESRQNLPEMEWAFQNGPILVESGNNLHFNSNMNSKYTRSGIGYKLDGTIVIIVTLTPMNLWDFACKHFM